jgi:hypothetical protein
MLAAVDASTLLLGIGILSRTLRLSTSSPHTVVVRTESSPDPTAGFTRGLSLAMLLFRPESLHSLGLTDI